MAYFNFNRLISKYSREFTVIVNSGGEYDAKGDWVDGEKREITMTGAIMAMSESKVYNSNGAYTSKDKVLYMTEPLSDALFDCDVKFLGNVYKIDSTVEADDADFTGVYHYILKWVSVFEETEAAQDD